MGTAVFRYSWRKMETAAHNTAGWRQVVCGLCIAPLALGVKMLMLSKS